jgi:hypothetical protein
VRLDSETQRRDLDKTRFRILAPLSYREVADVADAVVGVDQAARHLTTLESLERNLFLVHTPFMMFMIIPIGSLIPRVRAIKRCLMPGLEVVAVRDSPGQERPQYVQYLGQHGETALIPKPRKNTSKGFISTDGMG